MLLQALHVEIEMKNPNLQVTLLVQKGVGTPFIHPWISVQYILTYIWKNAAKHLNLMRNIRVMPLQPNTRKHVRICLL